MNRTRPPGPARLPWPPVAALALSCAVAGCDFPGDPNVQPPIKPATILNLSVTPNPVTPRAPLRVEVTLDDSSLVYDYTIITNGDGPRFGAFFRYSRFTTTAPADTGLYRLQLIVQGKAAFPAASFFTLTVRP